MKKASLLNLPMFFLSLGGAALAFLFGEALLNYLPFSIPYWVQCGIYLMFIAGICCLVMLLSEKIHSGRYVMKPHEFGAPAGKTTLICIPLALVLGILTQLLYSWAYAPADATPQRPDVPAAREELKQIQEEPQDSYIVLVLDTSSLNTWGAQTTYTAGSAIEHTREAARAFCQQIDQSNEIAIVSYDGQARVSSEFTKNQAALTQILDALDTRFDHDNTFTDGLGNVTSFGDIVGALELADDLLSSIPEDAVKNVVVFTSGLATPHKNEDGSWTNYSETGRYSEQDDGGWLNTESRIPLHQTSNAVYEAATVLRDKSYNVFSIGIFDNFQNVPSEMQQPVSLLRSVTEDIASSPGMFFEVDDVEKLVPAFVSIADVVIKTIPEVRYVETEPETEIEQPHLIQIFNGPERDSILRIILQGFLLTLWAVFAGVMAVLFLNNSRLITHFLLLRIILAVVFSALFAVLMLSDYGMIARGVLALSICLTYLPTYQWESYS